MSHRQASKDILEVCSIAEAFVEEHYGGDEFLVAEMMRACIRRVEAYAKEIDAADSLFNWWLEQRAAEDEEAKRGTMDDETIDA